MRSASCMQARYAKTRIPAVAAATIIVACAPSGARAPGEPEPLPPPPWSAEPLAAQQVPAPYLSAWRSAENRSSCAPIAFDDHGRPDATVRTASFSGGWGVAYDLAGLRSAFGVAGTGVRAGEQDTYWDWPYGQRWLDGSRAGYGPEGGTGPNLLAYLEIAGQGCLYNVWSRLGREHLERLLRALRYVQPSG